MISEIRYPKYNKTWCGQVYKSRKIDTLILNN